LSTDLGKFRILIVDDEPDIVELTAGFFQRKGLQVTTADSGREALLKAHKNKFDLIISDVRMPNGSGIDLIQSLNEKAMQIPLIFVTGFSDISDEELVGYGAKKVFHKPADRKELFTQAVNILLNPES